MMLYKDGKQLLEDIKDSLKVSEDRAEVVDEKRFKGEILESLVENVSLNENKEVKKTSAQLIRGAAWHFGIYPASIHQFYKARAREEFEGLTVPAINLRGFTYPASRALIRTALKNKSLAFIFELARSEMAYTNQPPIEYASVILAAAIKEGFQGPLFIQLDHGQVNLNKYQASPEEEIKELRDLIKACISAGFYNVDVDTSTLVDLSKPTIIEQQKRNFEIAAQLTKFIRENQPQGITVSVGGEIGEIGKKNSTPEELKAFMDGYNETFAKLGDFVGLSKISVQSGATHGGVILPDGSIARVKIDFDLLEQLSKIARQYGLAGTVQHGASTLPQELFDKFPEKEVIEVHLATEFQNMIYESPAFPKELREKMYTWIQENCLEEKKEDWTNEQFIYKLRKKAWGPFKKEVFNFSLEVKRKISQTLEEKFDFFFKKLNVVNSESLVKKYI